MHRAVVCLAVLALAGCATSSKPPKVDNETVRSGRRSLVAYHGRWKVDGETCIPRTPPRLEMVDRPAHGKAESERRDRKPSKCPKAFPHVAVYYTSEPGYRGPDRFTYRRIDPDTGKARLRVIEIEVE